MKQRLAAVGIALAVCAGYYLGSILGLLLRVPPATPSIIWPPNAILTAALLLVPPRRWWLVLLPRAAGAHRRRASDRLAAQPRPGALRDQLH